MNDLSRQTAARKNHIIAKLTRQHALLNDEGKPRRCTPTEAEIAYGRAASPNNGKVMFADQKAGEDFASVVLNSVGYQITRIYQCPRGGHWHTTTRGGAL